jgi:hypothetical protein
MKRPFGVTLIGILLLVQGLFIVAQVVVLTIPRSLSLPVVGRTTIAYNLTGLTPSDWLAAAVLGTLGIVITFSGIGILRLRAWAWLAAMALQGWTLAVLLFHYVTSGRSSYATMLLGVVIVFYLNSRTVRQTFDVVRNRRTAKPLGEPPAARPGVQVPPPVATVHERLARTDAAAHE